MHPEQLVGKGADRLKKLMNMVYAMKRVAKSHRTELEEALSTMTEAKMSSSIAATHMARENHLIQVMRNMTYYEHILSGLDAEMATLPRAVDGGPDTPERIAVREKVTKWEDHEKEEKGLNDLLEKRFHTDLKTAKGGEGQQQQQQQASGGAGVIHAGAGGNAGFKMVQELIPTLKLHAAMGPAEYQEWHEECVAWAISCRMQEADHTFQFQCFRKVAEAGFISLMDVTGRELSFDGLMRVAEQLWRKNVRLSTKGNIYST